MTYDELTNDQKTILAAEYLKEINDQHGWTTSLCVTTTPFLFVTDDEVCKHYDGTTFVNGDFPELADGPLKRIKVINSVEVIHYRHGVPTIETWKGTFDEIYDRLVVENDKLTYINSECYGIKSEHVQHLYKQYERVHGGFDCFIGTLIKHGRRIN